jgi:hypothetical protein
MTTMVTGRSNGTIAIVTTYTIVEDMAIITTVTVIDRRGLIRYTGIGHIRTIFCLL